MGTEITKEKGGKKTSHYIIQEQEEGPVSIRTKNRPPATNNHIQLRNKHNWRERAQASPSLRLCEEIILSVTVRKIDRVGKETCVRCPLISEANSYKCFSNHKLFAQP